MTADTRFALTLGVFALIVGQLFATTDISQSLVTDFRTLTNSNLWVYHLGSLGGNAFILFALTRPARADLARVLVAGSALAALFVWLTLSDASPSPVSVLILYALLGGCGVMSIATLAINAVLGVARARDLARHLLWVTLFVSLITLAMSSWLNFAIALQPGTYDVFALHVDASLGFQPSLVLGQYAVAFPWFKFFLRLVYSLLSFLPLALYALQLNSERAPPVSINKAWVVAIPIVYFAYFLYPVTGPLYMLGASTFPAYVPDLASMTTGVSIVHPAPRNGIPSMHFGWALLVWMNAGMLPNATLAKYVRAAAAVFLGLTALATLGLGEHYFIDLVIAVPFIIAVQALCTGVLNWREPARMNACVVGFGIYLMWVLGLRFGFELFTTVPGFTWVACILTIALSIKLYKPLARASMAASAQLPPMPLKESAPIASESAVETKKAVRYVGAMFVLSGIAGIMYEVLFSKSLALTFGSTSTATYTVLATYMGGIAIGSWLGGKIGARHSQPLVLYAVCEMAIAVYCALTPALFRAIQGIYISWASGITPDAPSLIAFRLTLGVLALLLPTILMGMTLPVLARFLQDRQDSLGKTVSLLYGANVLGAALGAVLAGYFVMPALGIQRTTLLAAVLNLMVALLAIELHKKLLGRAETPKPLFGGAGHALDQSAAGEYRWLGNFALVVLGIGGAVTLAIEVKYFHLLAVVAGNSTYAFSLMLFTFLLGLGAGAVVARRLLGWNIPLRALLGWLELGLACVILGGVFLWGSMPRYFESFASYPMVREFASREVVRAVVCWLAMFPPALFIGAIYPVAMECIGRARAANPIGALGFAAAFNTLGNIVGVLLGAFVLLPYLGALRSVQLLGVTCAVLGVIALWRLPDMRLTYRWGPALLVLALVAIQPASFDYSRLATGANVYFTPQGWGEIIDHAESVDGGLTSVALSAYPDQPPVRTLLTNGKFQGNDSFGGEVQAQLGFALSPLLHTAEREHALVIGYGTGMSAHTLKQAGFKHLDVVDLSADIVNMANKHFASVNGRVTDLPGVTTYITDGRNYLMLQDRAYDVIGMEISSIWFAGAASLYNREFYALAKKRLRPQGVLQQWMQLHHIAPLDLMRILGSVRSEFTQVWLYVIGGQGIIVASNHADTQPTVQHVDFLKRTESLRPLLDLLHQDPAELSKMLLLDPPATDRLLKAFGVPPGVWVSTDDNLHLEYSTPKGNAMDGKRSFEDNKRFLATHSKPALGAALAKE